MKRVLAILALAGMTTLAALPALAQPEAVEPIQAAVSGAWNPKTVYFVCVVIVAGLIMVVAEIFAVRGQTRAIETALRAIARQPNAVKAIQTNLIIGLALIESLAIYVLLIALILLFLNPFTQYYVS